MRLRGTRSPIASRSPRASGSRSIARVGGSGSTTTRIVPKISLDSLELEYASCGDPARPTILLVMGLGMQLVAWPDALCDALAAKGFHVVRFDNRDIGLSTHLDYLGFPAIGRQAIRYFLHLPLKSAYYIEDMARD